MCHKVVYFAVALSFVLLLSPRAISQDSNGSKHARETPIHRGILGPSNVISPAAHTDRRALEKDPSIAGFKELKESLGEYKEAQQFMQLKDAVYADLSRLEKSRYAEPRCDAVRGIDSNCQRSGNLAVNRANNGSIRELPAQAKSAVLPVSLIPAGSTEP